MAVQLFSVKSHTGTYHIITVPASRCLFGIPDIFHRIFLSAFRTAVLIDAPRKLSTLLHPARFSRSKILSLKIHWIFPASSSFSVHNRIRKASSPFQELLPCKIQKRNPVLSCNRHLRKYLPVIFRTSAQSHKHNPGFGKSCIPSLRECRNHTMPRYNGCHLILFQILILFSHKPHPPWNKHTKKAKVCNPLVNDHCIFSEFLVIFCKCFCIAFYQSVQRILNQNRTVFFIKTTHYHTVFVAEPAIGFPSNSHTSSVGTGFSRYMVFQIMIGIPAAT